MVLLCNYEILGPLQGILTAQSCWLYAQHSVKVCRNGILANIPNTDIGDTNTDSCSKFLLILPTIFVLKYLSIFPIISESRYNYKCNPTYDIKPKGCRQHPNL